MKASLKFRENQNPILKTKIPLTILSFPFRSGIEVVSTDPKDKELCLSFSTFSESGPFLKLVYRPNDPFRPFGLVVKTGTGTLGSPVEAPMTMSAEFGFLGNGNPSFSLQFKPRIGDFLIRRSVNSEISIPSSTPSCKTLVPFQAFESDDSETNEEKKSGNVTWTDLFSSGFAVEKAAEGLLGGEVCARTVFPIRNKLAAKIRWSMKFPVMESDHTGSFPIEKTPYMVVNKIGIEQHVGKDKAGNGSDVVGACLVSRKEAENLESENKCMWKEMEELKSEISAGKFFPATGGRKSGKSRETEKNSAVNESHADSYRCM